MTLGKEISFCTTCMGRLEFLKKTLRYNLNIISQHNNCELVLLDYNSNDGLGDWVRDNFKNELANSLLVYYRTSEPRYFHMSHAKNLSHRLGEGKILCNLDADNYLGGVMKIMICLINVRY
jgi:hypothetical protein